eukprot:9475949-Pyramimonas_sp.AAC.2
MRSTPQGPFLEGEVIIFASHLVVHGLGHGEGELLAWRAALGRRALRDGQALGAGGGGAKEHLRLGRRRVRAADAGDHRPRLPGNRLHIRRTLRDHALQRHMFRLRDCDWSVGEAYSDCGTAIGRWVRHIHIEGLRLVGWVRYIPIEALTTVPTNTPQQRENVRHAAKGNEKREKAA